MLIGQGSLSKDTLRLMKNTLKDTQYNYLVPETEFYSASATKDQLHYGGYFCKEQNVQFPAVIQENLLNEEVMSAVGGLLFYLKSVFYFKNSYRLVEIG